MGDYPGWHNNEAPKNVVEQVRYQPPAPAPAQQPAQQQQQGGAAGGSSQGRPGSSYGSGAAPFATCAASLRAASLRAMAARGSG